MKLSIQTAAAMALIAVATGATANAQSSNQDRTTKDASQSYYSYSVPSATGRATLEDSRLAPYESEPEEEELQLFYPANEVWNQTPNALPASPNPKPASRNGISALIQVSQLKADVANDEALIGADKSKPKPKPKKPK